MKIVVMSDSHGCNNEVDYVLLEESDAALYLHCGDICVDKHFFPQIHAVRGNNDYYDYPMERVVRVGNHRILMLHSHQLSYTQREEKMIRKAKEEGCDIVCYGHTHVPFYRCIDGIHVLNPGSLYHNRDGSGISYAIIHIDKEVRVEIKFIES